MPEVALSGPGARASGAKFLTQQYGESPILGPSSEQPLSSFLEAQAESRGCHQLLRDRKRPWFWALGRCARLVAGIGRGRTWVRLQGSSMSVGLKVSFERPAKATRPAPASRSFSPSQLQRRRKHSHVPRSPALPCQTSWALPDVCALRQAAREALEGDQAQPLGLGLQKSCRRPVRAPVLGMWSQAQP